MKSNIHSVSKLNKCLIAFILILTISLGGTACKEREKYTYKYLTPAYRDMQLIATGDTIKIPIKQNMSRSIKSINYFTDQGTNYLTYFDKVLHHVKIFDFNSAALIKSVDLKAKLPYRNLAKNTTIYYKNLDSLFVINDQVMYLFDRSFHIKDSIIFQSTLPGYPLFEQAKPPYFKNGHIYIAAKLSLLTTKRQEFKKWKTLYEVNMIDKKTKLVVDLPEHYLDSLYGYYFFKTTYCVNEKGLIVFSFPADTNLYATNLVDCFEAYNSKSAIQQSTITSLSKKELAENDGIKKAFLTRDSYKDIYFDPYNKIYIRIAEHKMTEKEFMLGKRFKSRSTIFLDENLRIIGESELDPRITLATLFFTNNKKMYVRANIRDRDALSFVRLEYKIDNNQLANRSIPIQ